MTKTNKDSPGIGKCILIIFGILCMFGSKMIPPMFGLSVGGFQVMGTLIGGIMLLLIDTGWSVALIFFSLCIIPELGMTTVLSSSLGNSIVFFAIFCFALSSVLVKRGIAKRIAIALMTSRLGRKGPWWTITFLFIASFILASFLSGALTFMMFLPIIYKIFEEIGCRPGEEDAGLTSLLIVGVVICTCIAQCATPISHTVTMFGMNFYQNYTGEVMDFGTYVLINFPVAVLVVVVWCLIARFLWNPDVSRLEGLDHDILSGECGPMGKGEKITAAVYILVLLAWIVLGLMRYIHPAFHANVLSKIGDAYPPLIGLLILCFLRDEENKPVVDYGDAMKSVSLNTIMYMAVVLAVSAAVSNQELGITVWMTETFGGILQGVNPMLFVILIIAVCILLTNFVPNVVVVTLGMSVAMPLVSTIYTGQVSPLMVAALITAGGSYAYAAPSACPTSAIACGTEWMKQGELLKWGMVSAVSAIIVSCLVGMPIGMLFG